MTTSASSQTLLPDLIDIQRSSFRWFLETGLIEELESFSPISDYTGKLELHFLAKNYKLKEPKYDVDEAKRRDAVAMLYKCMFPPVLSTKKPEKSKSKKFLLVTYP
jgi:DNA-directed RNA polymerase subunit beta